MQTKKYYLATPTNVPGTCSVTIYNIGFFNNVVGWFNWEWLIYCVSLIPPSVSKVSRYRKDVATDSVVSLRDEITVLKKMMHDVCKTRLGSIDEKANPAKSSIDQIRLFDPSSVPARKCVVSSDSECETPEEVELEKSVHISSTMAAKLLKAVTGK